MLDPLLEDHIPFAGRRVIVFLSPEGTQDLSPARRSRSQKEKVKNCNADLPDQNGPARIGLDRNWQRTDIQTPRILDPKGVGHTIAQGKRSAAPGKASPQFPGSLKAATSATLERA